MTSQMEGHNEIGTTECALLVAAIFIGLVAACEDEKPEDAVQVEPTPRVPGVRAPEGETRIAEVIIHADRLEPRQLNLTAGVPVEVQVGHRSGSDGTFFIGDYLTDLRVPAGQTAKMGMPIPEGRSQATVRMGCDGDERRQGSAVIEFKGVLPGTDR